MAAVIRRVVFCVLILILDQLTKYAVSHRLALGHSIPVVDGLFNITLVYNPGAAFGMFSTLTDSWRRLMLTGVSCIALIVVLRFMLHEAKHDPLSQFALTAILAGALGNLVDRYRLDSVIDFLDFYWKNYHWPAFNVADSAISLGVVALIWRMVFQPHPADAPRPVSTTQPVEIKT